MIHLPQILAMTYNFNGNLKSGEELSTTVLNRGMNYGDGVFETMKFANNRINFWEDHYFRLMSSMRILRMEIPMSFSPEFLEQEIRNTIEANDLAQSSSRVKILINRMPGGLYTPETNDIDYVIMVTPIEGSTFQINEKGLEVDLFKDFYKQKSMLSNLKLTAAPVLTLASIFRKENGLDECFLVNDDKHLVEAISSNVFLMKGDSIKTPSLASGCLKGIIRKKVIEIVSKLDVQLEEVDAISPFDLQKADEVFLTNSLKGIQWVSKYRKKEYSNEFSKSLINKLNIVASLS